MRIDVEPRNDSGAYSLVASGAAAAIAADERADDVQFVAGHRAMLFELLGDDSVRSRVVVDEPLTESERASLVTRVVGVLDLRCGRLLVCGGFDPRSFAAWARGEDDEYVRAVEVPPGFYQVEAGTTAESMNGRALAAGGAQAWYESADEGPIPAVGYAWLAALRRIAAVEDAEGPLTAPIDGWFPYDAGALPCA